MQQEGLQMHPLLGVNMNKVDRVIIGTSCPFPCMSDIAWVFQAQRIRTWITIKPQGYLFRLGSHNASDLVVDYLRMYYVGLRR